MPKELGQIHQINKTYSITGILEATTPFLLAKVDAPGELTSQLQRTVRAGCYYKTVGIDMSLGLDQELTQNASISGRIRYYAPTKGRCEAFRGAFKAVAQMMTTQGISMRDNPMYDFRVPLNDTPSLGAGSVTFPNQATLDGNNGLVLNTGTGTATSGLGIFQVHNAGVRPQYDGTASSLFSDGYATVLDSGTTRTDFVLNDTVLYSGNDMVASIEYEEIPFQIAYSQSGDGKTTPTFQFRPDPALYIAVMCGQYEIVVDDLQVLATVGLQDIDLNLSIMVSGWKSIMGNPDKKRSSKKNSKKSRK